MLAIRATRTAPISSEGCISLARASCGICLTMFAPSISGIGGLSPIASIFISSAIIISPYTEDLPQYKAEGGSTGLLGLTTVGTNNSVSSTDSSMAGPLSNTTSFLPSYQGENTIISAAPLSEPVGFRQKNNETDTAISPSPTITTPEPVVTETAPRFDPALYDQ